MYLFSHSVIAERMGGPIIGLEGILAFQEDRVDLREGDKIVFYTDGILDHRNERGEFFGKNRLLAKLTELKDRPMDELLSELLSSVMAFGSHEKLRDDLSLLGVEYKGP